MRTRGVGNMDKEWVNSVQEYILSFGYDGPLRTVCRKSSVLFLFGKNSGRYWLKIYFSTHERLAESEARVLSQLHKAGCSVPYPVFGKILKFQEIEGDVLLMSEVYGVKLTKGLSVSIEVLVAELCRVHENMNRISSSEVSLLKKAFLPKRDDKAFLRLEMTEKLRELRKKYKYRPKQLIHGDVYEDNLFFNETEVSIIDFSDMKMGIIEEDVANVVRLALRYDICSIEHALNSVKHYYKNIDTKIVLVIAAYNEVIYGNESRARKIAVEIL